MKKLFLFSACITLFFVSSANSTEELKSILKEKVTFGETALPIEKNSVHFVRVSFKINEDGLINILEANYSSSEIKKLLFKKLSQINLKDVSFKEDVYYYEFTFRKE